ncbi:hypothetical protein DIRU0_B04192 [Diutina rugosa]
MVIFFGADYSHSCPLPEGGRLYSFAPAFATPTKMEISGTDETGILKELISEGALYFRLFECQNEAPITQMRLKNVKGYGSGTLTIYPVIRVPQPSTSPTIKKARGVPTRSISSTVPIRTVSKSSQSFYSILRASMHKDTREDFRDDKGTGSVEIDVKVPTEPHSTVTFSASLSGPGHGEWKYTITRGGKKRNVEEKLFFDEVSKLKLFRCVFTGEDFAKLGSADSFRKFVHPTEDLSNNTLLNNASEANLEELRKKAVEQARALKAAMPGADFLGDCSTNLRKKRSECDSEREEQDRCAKLVRQDLKNSASSQLEKVKASKRENERLSEILDLVAEILKKQLEHYEEDLRDMKETTKKLTDSMKKAIGENGLATDDVFNIDLSRVQEARRKLNNWKPHNIESKLYATMEESAQLNEIIKADEVYQNELEVVSHKLEDDDLSYVSHVGVLYAAQAVHKLPQDRVDDINQWQKLATRYNNHLSEAARLEAKSKGLVKGMEIFEELHSAEPTGHYDGTEPRVLIQMQQDFKSALDAFVDAAVDSLVKIAEQKYKEVIETANLTTARYTLASAFVHYAKNTGFGGGFMTFGDKGEITLGGIESPNEHVQERLLNAFLRAVYKVTYHFNANTRFICGIHKGKNEVVMDELMRGLAFDAQIRPDTVVMITDGDATEK